MGKQYVGYEHVFIVKHNKQIHVLQSNLYKYIVKKKHGANIVDTTLTQTELNIISRRCLNRLLYNCSG
jgi:hypothetical protein